MIAGLASAGVDVLRLGVVPTPCVAYLTQTLDVDLGVMISASHNPMPDNGIKFFARGGVKLPDAVEDAIAGRMRSLGKRPTGAGVGRVRRFDQEGVRSYLDHLVRSVPHRLDGLRVVVDVAHGRHPGWRLRRYAGRGRGCARHRCRSDGWNINDGGGDRLISISSGRRSSRPELTRVWRTTATRTAASPSRPRATWSTVTRSWPFSRWPSRPGRPPARHGGCDRDEQSGLPACDGAGPGRGSSRRRSVTATCSRR